MKDNQNTVISPLHSKAELADDPQALDFIKSLPPTFADAEKLLSSNHVEINDNVLKNRIKLETFIRKFHSEADTLNDSIIKQWVLLNDPTTKLLVSTHQPNLFAYGGIFKKVVLLETLKSTIENRKGQGIVNLFVIIDHDFIDEIWMRRAQLPSFHHSSGLLQLRLAVNPSKKWEMVCNIPRPPETTLYNWKRELISWIKKSSSSPSHRKKMMDNLNRFWKVVEVAYSKARSYSDFNSFLMSNIVNGIWGYNTLFVRLSEISSVLTDGFEFLISNLSTYTDVLTRTEQTLLSHGISTGVSTASYDKAPIWLHCKCGSKAPISLSTEGKLSFKGSCVSCKAKLTLDLQDPHNPDLSKVISYISPRAIAIPLLLSRDLGISCYCSGKGGLGYLVDANMISKHLGIRWPVTLVWGSKDVYNGTAQNQAFNAINMDIPEAEKRLQYLQSKNNEYSAKIHDLVTKRAELARANSSLSGLLEDLFQLKEEQRRIRREIDIVGKATKIFSLSPCILDYAVNFGMADTEKQWWRHLLKDGNLTSPVYFNLEHTDNDNRKPESYNDNPCQQ
jgi:cell division protein FtsB